MYISLLIIETLKFVVTYYTIWFNLELSNRRNFPTIWFNPSQNSLFSNSKKCPKMWSKSKLILFK